MREAGPWQPHPPQCLWGVGVEGVVARLGRKDAPSAGERNPHCWLCVHSRGLAPSPLGDSPFWLLISGLGDFPSHLPEELFYQRLHLLSRPREPVKLLLAGVSKLQSSHRNSASSIRPRRSQSAIVEPSPPRAQLRLAEPQTPSAGKGGQHRLWFLFFLNLKQPGHLSHSQPQSPLWHFNFNVRFSEKDPLSTCYCLVCPSRC